MAFQEYCVLQEEVSWIKHGPVYCVQDSPHSRLATLAGPRAGAECGRDDAEASAEANPRHRGDSATSVPFVGATSAHRSGDNEPKP